MLSKLNKKLKYAIIQNYSKCKASNSFNNDNDLIINTPKENLIDRQTKLAGVDIITKPPLFY